MSTGFVGGLAEGWADGYALGSRIRDSRRQRREERDREQAFAQQQRQRQQQAAAQQAGSEPLTPQLRQQLQDALGAAERGKQQLAQQQSLANRNLDLAQADALQQQLQQLHQRSQELLRHLGGSELKQYAGEAQRLNDDLVYGRRSFGDLTPGQASQLVVFHTGHPVADLLDSQAGPSRVGQGLAQFRDGLANLRGDGGQRLLEAVNTLWGHELDGLVGQHAWDGSTVTGAEFAAPVPHPASPQHLLLTAKLSTRDPDGRAGTAYVPVTEDHGQLLAHPEQSAGATVKSLGLDELLHRYHELDTLHRTLNTDPQIRAKLIDASLQGHDDTGRRMLDWMRVLGRNPRGWAPQLKPAQLDLGGGAPAAADTASSTAAQDYSHLWGAGDG